MLLADSDEVAPANANAKANVIHHALSDWNCIQYYPSRSSLGC